MAIRDVIGKYLPLPSTPVPQNNTKKAYGSVELSFVRFHQMTRIESEEQIIYCFIETIVAKLYQRSFTIL